MFENGLVIDTPLFGSEYIKDYSVGWDVELYETAKNIPLRIGLKGFHTPNIQLVFANYSSAYLLQGFSPKNSVIVAFLDTPGIVNYRNQRYKSYEMIVLRHPEEIDLVLSQGSYNYSFAIEEKFFYSNFYAFFGKEFDDVIDKYHITIDRIDIENFRSFCRFWSSYFLQRDRMSFLLSDHDKIEEEIIETLFGFFQIEGEKRNRTNKTLKAAREILHAKIDEEIRFVEISKMLGVSQRTLEYTFKNNLGISSKRYLQLLKLNAIRQELLLADPSKTKISDIALKYGFFHMGHFGSEYKKLFGKTPKETLYKG